MLSSELATSRVRPSRRWMASALLNRSTASSGSPRRCAKVPRWLSARARASPVSVSSAASSWARGSTVDWAGATIATFELAVDAAGSLAGRCAASGEGPRPRGGRTRTAASGIDRTTYASRERGVGSVGIHGGGTGFQEYRPRRGTSESVVPPPYTSSRISYGTTASVSRCLRIKRRYIAQQNDETRSARSPRASRGAQSARW